MYKPFDKFSWHETYNMSFHQYVKEHIKVAEKDRVCSRDEMYMRHTSSPQPLTHIKQKHIIDISSHESPMTPICADMPVLPIKNRETNKDINENVESIENPEQNSIFICKSTSRVVKKKSNDAFSISPQIYTRIPLPKINVTYEDLLYNLRATLVVDGEEVYDSKNIDMLYGNERYAPIRCENCKSFCLTCKEGNIKKNVSLINNMYPVDILFTYMMYDRKPSEASFSPRTCQYANVNKIDYIFNRYSPFKEVSFEVLVYDENILKKMLDKKNNYLIFTYEKTRLPEAIMEKHTKNICDVQCVILKP